MTNSKFYKGIITPALIFIQITFVLVLVQSCGNNRMESQENEFPDGGESDVNSLVTGRIAYDLSDSMKIGIQTQVVASITKAQNDSILFLTLDSSAFVKENIMVSSKVKMALIDPSSGKDFQIQALNSEEQFVGSSSNTTWRWTVTPLRSGQTTLILRATVTIVSDMGQVPKDVPVFEKQVNVLASPLLTVQQFIGDNWQWLIGSSVSPILIWSFRKRFRRRKTLSE